MQSMLTSTLMGFLLFSGTSSIGTLQKLGGMLSSLPAGQVYSVSVTGYNAVADQTDSEPFITASGAYSNPDIVVARSVDLADELPFGTVIEIAPSAATSTPNCGLSVIGPFIGLRVVADSMNPRKRNQIDILFDSDVSERVGGKHMNPATTLGFCKDVDIRVVGRVNIAKMPRSQIELAGAIGQAKLAFRN